MKIFDHATYVEPRLFLQALGRPLRSVQVFGPVLSRSPGEAAQYLLDRFQLQGDNSHSVAPGKMAISTSEVQA